MFVFFKKKKKVEDLLLYDLHLILFLTNEHFSIPYLDNWFCLMNINIEYLLLQ